MKAHLGGPALRGSWRVPNLLTARLLDYNSGRQVENRLNLELFSTKQETASPFRWAWPMEPLAVALQISGRVAASTRTTSSS